MISQFTLMKKKKNLVKNLLERTVNLAKFMCDCYGGMNVEVNLNLMFLIMIKNSKVIENMFRNFEI